MPLPTAGPSLPPAKKRKVSTRHHDDLARIQRLEKLLLEAVSEGTSLNPLVDLLDAAAGAGDPHVLFRCIYSLYRVFASIIDTGMLAPTPDSGTKVVRTWIWERLNVFTDMLVGLMSDSEKSLRVSVFQYAHLGYKSSSLDFRDTNSFLPPQALVVFFVLRPGWAGTFHLV
jgi:U3 small nucleolar RNA-associated protein 19